MFSHNRRWTSVYKCLVATPMQSTCKATVVGIFHHRGLWQVYDIGFGFTTSPKVELKFSRFSKKSLITSHHFDILDLHWKRMETLNLTAAELIPWSRKKGITWLKDPGKITWLRMAAHIYIYISIYVYIYMYTHTHMFGDDEVHRLEHRIH